jgi:hypothetical protein
LTLGVARNARSTRFRWFSIVDRRLFERSSGRKRHFNRCANSAAI